MREGRPSETARIVCLMRALEYAWRGSESLLGDAYARLFLPAHYRSLLGLLSGPAGRLLARPAAFIYESVILRSAFMDAMTREYAAELPVVLLGAGFDSRGLRLRESISRGIHEIDFPATQEHKREILRDQQLDTEYARFHPADFTKQSAGEILSTAGLAGRPALVIWEGVSMYLPEQTVFSVLREVGESLGPGTVLVADFWRDSLGPLPMASGPARVVADVLFSEPILYGTSPGGLRSRARARTGAACETFTIAELRERFGRPGVLLPDPMFLARFRY